VKLETFPKIGNIG